jgi:transposase-like protein
LTPKAFVQLGFSFRRLSSEAMRTPDAISTGGDELLRRFSAPNASPMTTDEAIRALLPTEVIQRALREAVEPGRGRPRRLAASPETEDRCRAFLERLRWPDGVRCPRCEADEGISRIEMRGQFECGACGYQFSVRVGTVFHATHLPLWKWYLAVYLIAGSLDSIPASRLSRMLDVSYKSAWHLNHRVRAAMEDGPARSPRAVTELDQATRSRMGHKARHLDAYRTEQRFHADNRSNPYLFGILLSRLIGIEAVPYSRLIATA